MSTNDKNIGPKDQSVYGWRVGEHRIIEHQFTESEVNSFAELTGDYNPLHLDQNYASTTSAGDKVVHGMLVASFVSTLIGMEIPGPGALWNDFQVSWRKMVRIGDVLKFKATITSVNVSLDLIMIDIKGVGALNNELYLDGSAKVMIMDKKKMVKSSILSESKILVTGATGILGSAVCRRFAEEGAKLVLWGRDVSKLEKLRNELHDAVIDMVCCDLSDENSVHNQGKKLFYDNNVDGIVHTAASSLFLTGSVDSTNLIELKKHLDIGVIALQQLATSFMQNRREKKRGFITAVLTEAIYDVPPVKMSAYVAAKMASWGLIKSYANELGPLGVRCNAVSPGLMETPYSKNISIRTKKIEEAKNPMRRICTPDDVAMTILFLSVSGFINGVNLPVTGGQRMP